MKPSGLTLVLLLAALAPATLLHAGADSPTPRKVAYDLLHTALKHFGFTADTLKFEKKFLAPDLYARLLKKANTPVPKGDAPDTEGDVFLDCQDPPTSLNLPPNGNIALQSGPDIVQAVPVDLAWSSEQRHYRVLLQQIDGAWKVYDIDFGKDGKLTDILK